MTVNNDVATGGDNTLACYRFMPTKATSAAADLRFDDTTTDFTLYTYSTAVGFSARGVVTWSGAASLAGAAVAVLATALAF
jgi:hypothetical protein